MTQTISTNTEILQHFGKNNYEKNEHGSALNTAQFPPSNVICICKLEMSDVMRREIAEHKQEGLKSKVLPTELITFPAIPLF